MPCKGINSGQCGRHFFSQKERTFDPSRVRYRSTVLTGIASEYGAFFVGTKKVKEMNYTMNIDEKTGTSENLPAASSTRAPPSSRKHQTAPHPHWPARTEAAESGTHMVPSVLCLNDQGDSVMEFSEDVSGTLRAREHGHQPLILYDNHGKDARYKGPLDIAPTVGAAYGTGGNNQPPVSPSVFTRKRTDVCKDDDAASTESARRYKDATDLVLQEAEAEGPLLIRRLTPLECERPQGFPDGWTDIPGASDSVRCRALGNSAAIPCVEYIMRGITMAAGFIGDGTGRLFVHIQNELPLGKAPEIAVKGAEFPLDL